MKATTSRSTSRNWKYQGSQVWRFPSSSSSRVYETLRQPDGTMSCNCPGWCFKKAGRARHCKHIAQVTQ